MAIGDLFDFESILKVGSIAVAFASLWLGFHRYFKGQKQKVFEDYSTRYTKIFTDFFETNNSFDIEFKATEKSHRQFALSYWFLVSEEVFLIEDGKIDPKVWEVWKSGVVWHLKYQFFQDSYNWLKTISDIESEKLNSLFPDQPNSNLHSVA
jgi:hypothetical protein